MTLPAIRAIKKGRPDARVTILCKAKLADFWSLVPEVDEVVTIAPGDSVFAVARKLRGKFDVGILLPNSIRTALEMWLAGIPRRVGYRAKWRSLLLNQIVSLPKNSVRPRHQIHHYLRIAEKIGADIRDKSVAVREHAPIVGMETLRIGLCPGAEYGSAKRWMAQSFAATASEVAHRRDVEWVLFGTSNEESLGKEIEAGIDGACRNLIGKTTLLELADELSACKALLTNDTGTMHLAAMLDVPVVAVFGSTEPKLTGPLGARHTVIRHQVACSPCFLRTCPLDFRCMKAVEVDEVVEAVLRKL